MSSRNTTPKPEEIHYAAKVQNSTTVKEAMEYWLREAHTAMLYELCEEIEAGHRSIDSDWWRAEVHKRALELIDADDEMRPVYQAGLHKQIEDEALYHYAGYESAEEWFASEANLKKGGMKYELRFIASVLIPWCKAQSIFKSDQIADDWFFTPKNKNGESRIRKLRNAIPELRRIIDNAYEDEISPQEQRVFVSNILKDVGGNLPGEKFKEDLNKIRGAKPVIRLHKNGDGRWHGAVMLDDYQLQRFKIQNEHSTILIIEPDRIEETDPDVYDWVWEGYDWQQ